MERVRITREDSAASEVRDLPQAQRAPILEGSRFMVTLFVCTASRDLRSKSKRQRFQLSLKSYTICQYMSRCQWRKTERCAAVEAMVSDSNGDT